MASDVGWACGLCGLSDVGAARFVEFGFKLHPCRECTDHFRPLLPPEPEPDPEVAAAVEDSSSPRPVEETTDTASSSEPGTLW